MHRFIKMQLQTKGVAVKQKEKEKKKTGSQGIMKEDSTRHSKYLAPRVEGERNWEMLSVKPRLKNTEE